MPTERGMRTEGRVEGFLVVGHGIPESTAY